MTLRLKDLEAPLEDVEFPNGTNHIPVPFGAAEYRIWRDMKDEPDNEKKGAMLKQLVAACYPTATEYDIDCCTGVMLIAMAAHAGHMIERVKVALKNVVAAVAAAESQPPAAPIPVTAPSSPKTSGVTSSRKSRKPSAAIGGTSTSPDLTASLT